jgi:hypothetical protein
VRWSSGEAVRVVAASIALLTLFACTRSGPATLSWSTGRTSPTASVVPSRAHAPSPNPTVRTPLALTADLSERPAQWHRLAMIPFGSVESRLGLELPPVHTSVPLMPRSFTVAPDGTLWILDVVKHRVAHYSAAGTYLGDVGGLSFDRFHPQPRDLAFWGERLYVLHQFHLAASFREVRGPRLGPAVEVADADGDPLVMTTIYPSSGVPMGLSDGVAALDRLGTGPVGIGRISLDGRARFDLSDGLPVDASTSVSLDSYRERSFRLVTSGAAGRVVQPMTIRMVAGGPADAHGVGGIFADRIQGGADGALILWLEGAPARPADADAYGGGNWLLRYPTDGSPLAFERLPEAALDDSFQARHLAADVQGQIYLMLTLRHGMAIYRR